jgi:hypothetical protein
VTRSAFFIARANELVLVKSGPVSSLTQIVGHAQLIKECLKSHLNASHVHRCVGYFVGLVHNVKVNLKFPGNLTYMAQLRYSRCAGWSSLVARRAHNPPSGIGSLNPARQNGRPHSNVREDHSSKSVEPKPAVRVRQYRTKPRKIEEGVETGWRASRSPG